MSRSGSVRFELLPLAVVSGVVSAALNEALSRALFDTNIVASLLAPSHATSLGHALLGLLFLLNRLWLCVAWPSLCIGAITHWLCWLAARRIGGARSAVVATTHIQGETPCDEVAAR